MSKTPLPNVERARRGPVARAGTLVGRGVRLLLVGLLFLPLVACATKADIRDLQDEIREMSARNEALMRELQQEQRAQRDSIRAVSGQLTATRAQLAGTLRDMEDQIIRLQEFAGLSQQELAALRDQMERRPVPQPGGFDPMEPAGEGEARELYDLAMTQYTRGSLTSARFGFEDVLERFPTHEVAPSARYYLADILVQEGHLEEAIRAFETIPEYHPDAPRVPDALLRIGLLHRELGNLDEARRHLQRVVNTWPDTSAADQARTALREMG